MSTAEFARRARVGQRAARTALKALVAAGLAAEYRDGRTIRYFAHQSGGRPDLGMKSRVSAAAPRIDSDAVRVIGRSHARSRLLGLLGDDEVFEEAALIHRLVYRVGFQEKVKRRLLGRLVGPSHDECLGCLYLHPITLDVLVLSSDEGIRFEPAERLPEHASQVDDLDGVVSFADVKPGALDFDEDEWRARRPPAEAKKRVRELFPARPGAVTPVFVPLWRLVLRRGAGQSYRVQTIDGFIGKPVTWPEPAHPRSSR